VRLTPSDLGQVTVVNRPRNYAMIFLLVLCVVSGVTEWFHVDPPNVVTTSLPIMGSLYTILTPLGGIVALAGVCTTRLKLGTPLELAGLTLLVGVMEGYAVMMSFIPHPPQYVVAAIMATFGVVCFARVRQLWHDVQGIRRSS
jgi:hypothetical protein